MNWPISSAFRIASVTFCSSALLFAATGCEDANDLGVEVPGASPISTEYRDYSVQASTILQDSVETLNAERALAGRVTDNVLGTTTAKALFNLRVSSDSLPSQFTSPQLDSVVLALSFDQVYGSTAKPISFDLYNLPTSLEEKKTYNAGVSVPLGAQIGSNLLSSLNRTKIEQRKNGLKMYARDATGKVIVVNNVKQVGTVDSTTGVTVPDQTIRLVLQKTNVRNSDFANQLFAALKDASFSQAKLNDLWKGLALVPSDNYSGAVAGLSRVFENRVYFYFHATKAGSTKPYVPKPYSIRVANSYGVNDPNAPRYYTQISTEFKAPFDQLNDPTKSVTTPEGLAYMQEGVGLATKLVIPDLESLKGQTALAINRAELLIPVKSSGSLLFPSPVQAFVYELNAKNRVLLRTVNTTPIERVIQANLGNPLGEGNEAIVSLYTVSPTNKYYSVVITTYLQAYLANQLGEQPAAFMLSPVLRRAFSLSLNRSVLDAQNIKLRVYSSKLR